MVKDQPHNSQFHTMTFSIKLAVFCEKNAHVRKILLNLWRPWISMYWISSV